MRETVAVLGPGAVGGDFAVRFLQARLPHDLRRSARDRAADGARGDLARGNGGEPLVVRPEVTERLVQPVSLLLVTVKAPISRTRSSASSRRPSPTASSSRS